MPVRALAVHAQHPLAFAASAWLVQLSRGTSPEGAFNVDTLLVNGCFMLRPGTLRRERFELVRNEPLGLEEIEFPWFFAYHSRDGYFLCRGELAQRVDLDERTFKRWDVRMSLAWPRGLIHHITVDRLDHGMNAKVPFVQKVAGDIRHSSHREEIVNSLSLDLNEHYIDALTRERGEERVAFYRQLIRSTA
jgi:hypothetical protein